MLSWSARSMTCPGSVSGCSGDPSRSSPSPLISPGQAISPCPIRTVISLAVSMLSLRVTGAHIDVLLDSI